jgi:hypothetical protein
MMQAKTARMLTMPAVITVAIPEEIQAVIS